MKIKCLVAASLLLMGTAEVAQAEQAQAAAQPGAGANQEEKLICKVERVTGSLTNRRRICMSAAEWRMIAEKTGTAMDRLMSDAAKTHANPITFQ